MRFLMFYDFKSFRPVEPTPFGASAPSWIAQRPCSTNVRVRTGSRSRSAPLDSPHERERTSLAGRIRASRSSTEVGGGAERNLLFRNSR